MLKRLKRLHKLWKLAKEQPEAAKELESELLPGKAEFLAPMDEAERNEYVKKVEEGWGGVIERFRENFKS